MNRILWNNNYVILLKVASLLEIGAEYYNPKVGLWEPVIERVGFSVDYVKSEISNIK